MVRRSFTWLSFARGAIGVRWRQLVGVFSFSILLVTFVVVGQAPFHWLRHNFASVACTHFRVQYELWLIVHVPMSDGYHQVTGVWRARVHERHCARVGVGVGPR